MFLLISGGHIGVPKRYTNMASPYKALQSAWNISANSSETVGHRDLRLEQIVYALVFYNISFSWLLLLDGFQFTFLLRDSDSRYTWVTKSGIGYTYALTEMCALIRSSSKQCVFLETGVWKQRNHLRNPAYFDILK